MAPEFTFGLKSDDALAQAQPQVQSQAWFESTGFLNTGEQKTDPSALARAEIAAHEKADAARNLLARGVGVLVDSDSQSLARLKKLNDDYDAALRSGDKSGAALLEKQLTSQIAADKEAVNFKETVCSYGTGFLKTMGLFMRGRAGAVALGAYALDSVNPNDSAGMQLFDGGLGYAKGLGLQTVFGKVGQMDAGLAVKGVTMGVGSRMVELGLDRHNWNSEGLQVVSRQVFSKEALITDVAVFGLAHGLIKGGNGLTKGLLERSPVLSNASTAFSFGLVSGTGAEVQRQVNAGATLSNLDFLKVAQVGGIQAALDAVASGPGGIQARHALHRQMSELTDNHKFKDIVATPTDMRRAIQDLKIELEREVPVQFEGKLTNPYSLVEADPRITRADKDMVWQTLATARESFLTMESRVAQTNPAKNYQWDMNWKHTRAEFGEAWEATRLDDMKRHSQGMPGLSSREIRDSLITSMYSDHIKTPGPRSAGGNFIIHNIHGAEAAAEVLTSMMNPNRPADMASISRIVRGIREHQVAPPVFMAKMATHAIASELGLGTFIKGLPLAQNASAEMKAHHLQLNAIYDKIADPFNVQNLTPDLTKITFTPAERVYLDKAGIKEWYVPHPANGDDSLMAKIVVAADHSINYNTPDGLAKFAFIRQPGKEAIFQDPTFGAALDTVTSSFKSSREVLDPLFHTAVDAKFERSMEARRRTELIMDNLFRQTPEMQSTLSGQERLARALADARQAQPNLFAVWSAPLRSQAESDFMKSMQENVGKKLDDWKHEQGLIPVIPNGLEFGSTAGKLPYWDMPLSYPAFTPGLGADLSSFNALAKKQFGFAKVISGIGQELLRAEHWRY